MFFSSTSNRFTIFFNDSYKWLRAKCFREGQCEWRHRIPFSHLFGNDEVSIGLTRVLGRHSRCPISVTNVLLITIPLFLERDGPERYIVNHIFDIVVFYVELQKPFVTWGPNLRPTPHWRLPGVLVPRVLICTSIMSPFVMWTRRVHRAYATVPRRARHAIAMRTPGKRECGAISLAKANH